MKISENRKTFLSTAQDKFLKVGFITAIALVIIAFHIPFHPAVPQAHAFSGPEVDAPPITIMNTSIKYKTVPLPDPIKPEHPNPVIDPVIDLIDIDPEPIDEEPVDLTEPLIMAPDTFGMQETKDMIWEGLPQHPPSFPGGEKALFKFLSKTDYCEEALENGEGGTVHVLFVVNKMGKIKNIEIAGNGVHPCLDRAALKRVAEMPDWIPGKQGLEKVSVRMHLPFRFVPME